MVRLIILTALCLVLLAAFLHTWRTIRPAVQQQRSRYEQMDRRLDEMDEQLAELREAVR